MPTAKADEHYPPQANAGYRQGKQSNGRRAVHGCSNRTSVAARLSLRTTDGESHETVHSALWQRARRRHGFASCPSDRGGIPPVEIAGADRARSRCPSAFAMLTASEHRPSTRSQKRSANRLRTRCGRACNRYGDKCQVPLPRSHEPTVTALDAGSGEARHDCRFGVVRGWLVKTHRYLMITRSTGPGVNPMRSNRTP